MLFALGCTAEFSKFAAIYNGNIHSQVYVSEVDLKKNVNLVVVEQLLTHRDKTNSYENDIIMT